MENNQQVGNPGVSGVIYVMGVSGCGKSTVAGLLAERLGVPFCEADKLHPDTNIRKMAAGTPLTDNDREPWLQQVSINANELARHSECCVVACSSLKHRYRDILRQAHPITVFVYMKGSFQTIYTRMSARTGHFMPESLLQSQFDALEEPGAPENVIKVNIDSPPAVIVEQIIACLSTLHRG